MASMEETISLQELFKTVRKRFVFILSVVTIAVTIAGVVSYNYLTPIYEASTQILINQQKDTSKANLTAPGHSNESSTHQYV